MDTLSDNRFGLGGNNPPEPIEELRASLAATHELLAERQANILEMVVPAEVDAEVASKIADSIKVCMAFTKNSETARVSAKEPHLAAERAVDAFFKHLSDPVDKLKARLSALLTGYQRKVADEERRRLDAEAAAERERARKADAEARTAREAARKAEEEAKAASDADAKRLRDEAAAQREVAQKAEAAAEAKPADLTRTRTDLGAVASLRRTWNFEIENVDQVPRMFLTVDHAAIRAFIRARTDKKTGDCSARVDGVRIYEQHDSIVR